MKYITINNFEKYQHYTDRPIKWVKLYTDILYNDRFLCLTCAERWIYLGLILVSAHNKGSIIYDLSYIKPLVCHRLTKYLTLAKACKHIEKVGLIAITTLSKRYQLARPDKIRIDKNRLDKNNIYIHKDGLTPIKEILKARLHTSS